MTAEKDQVKPKKKGISERLEEKGLVITKKSDLLSKALAESTETAFFSPVAWEQFREMANAFIKSGALPKETNAEQLMVKMQAGAEMGMKPFEAMRSLYIVNGMIAIGGRDLIKQLRKHGWQVLYTQESDTSITATVSKDKESYTDTFTFEEAVKSGWTSSSSGLKFGWKEGANRNLKMRYAVISKIVKSYLPEVMGSAVDVAEVAEDATMEVTDTQMGSEDFAKIQNAQTFAELTEVTKSLQGKYKVRVLKQAYDNRKAELE